MASPLHNGWRGTRGPDFSCPTTKGRIDFQTRNEVGFTVSWRTLEGIRLHLERRACPCNVFSIIISAFFHFITSPIWSFFDYSPFFFVLNACDCKPAVNKGYFIIRTLTFAGGKQSQAVFAFKDIFISRSQSWRDSWEKIVLGWISGFGLHIWPVLPVKQENLQSQLRIWN